MRGGPFLWQDGTMETQHGLSYCADMVRRLDKDRFLTALFAPEPGRARLMALYAFNLEVARTREQVSEPMIGEIRLQWWRDALDAIYKGSPPEHEVAQALARAIGEAQLERGVLDRLIDARSFDLYDAPMATLDDLVRYLEDTSSGLMAAGVTLLSGNQEAGAHQAVKQAGIAWGLTGMLRALPFHIERSQQFVPEEILKRHDVVWSDFLHSEERSRNKSVIDSICDLATEAADRGRSASRDLPKESLPPLMPVVLTPHYLRQLRRPDVDPCKDIPEVPVFRKQLTLMKHALLGRL